MDPITAIGLASAIIGFVQVGVQVGQKIAEVVRAAPGEVPRPLENISLRIPLLTNALARIKTEAQVQSYDPTTRTVLLAVVRGCTKVVGEVDQIADKITPKPGEKLAGKIKKALVSVLGKEDKINELDDGLQAYIQILILHQVVDRSDVGASLATEQEHYLVKERRLSGATAREDLLSRLDGLLYRASRGFEESPVLVTLHGKKGVGKTQLALEYCQHANTLGQFRTILWLDAASPTTLALGLEQAASTIRNSRKGTGEEKRTFLNDYLAARWNPWLLVLDGYDADSFQSQKLLHVLPSEGHGALLVTARMTASLESGATLKVPVYKNESEMRDLRVNFTSALHRKDLDFVTNAIDEFGLDPNSYGRTVFGNDSGPLISLAAQLGFSAAVKLLLDRGAVLVLDKYMSAPISNAAQGGYDDIVTMCLDREDSLGSRDEAHNYLYAYRGAIAGNHGTTLNVLLNRRLEYLEPNNNTLGEGYTNAAKEGHLEVFEMLLAVNRFPTSPLIHADCLRAAVTARRLDVIQFLVEKAHANLDAMSSMGDTVLYEACRASNSEGPNGEDVDEIVAKLLALGASASVVCSRNGRVPVHIAAENNHVGNVRHLVAAGASVTVKDERGQIPILLAAQYKGKRTYTYLAGIKIEDEAERELYFSRCLHTAVAKNDMDLAIVVLKPEAIDEPDPASGDTPLLAAIARENLPMSRLLIRKGARQGVPGKDGRTALLLAAERGLTLVMRELLKAKDSPGVDVRDARGNTPLMLAVRAGKEPAVRLLLDELADRDAMNDFAETAMDVAEELDLAAIVQLLQI